MEKTIAAVSTPPGVGGIAVIRISGENAVDIADRVYKGKSKLCDVPTHTVHYGFIKNKDGVKIDEALVTVMRAPRSFTAEDVVEISIHGSAITARETLAAVIDAGAAAAGPGEFTKRAFLNGRIDLSQAEAVIDIINSKNEMSRKNALSQLEGGLSDKINGCRDRLVGLAASMQVIIDYPDEDLEDVTAEDIIAVCGGVLGDVKRLIGTADRGRIIQNGIKTAIAGKPNVGKSSLMNILSGGERAIVTDIAGTTRDVIEEYADIGVPLRLLDTAGIRETEDKVEKIGVERSKRCIEEADLVIVMLDAERGVDDEDRLIIQSTEGKKRIIVVNKTDLKGDISGMESGITPDEGEEVIGISAKSGEGVERLAERIKEMYSLGELEAADMSFVTNMRHRAALEGAEKALARATDALEAGMPSDIASIDINEAIDALGEITGATVSEDIVNEIFHSFCVGK
ncbi:MAG: tRNA uridine-5-carboxymethylaminomethyl(34) synthesis GTPase MnmE [Oscillospiraceae bacterium]|nr:tRNA uridine-5-carboxymethylaminomethyl(34) synthesis GTPase MnmE [Oscillospiraceae bacterium]